MVARYRSDIRHARIGLGLLTGTEGRLLAVERGAAVARGISSVAVATAHVAGEAYDATSDEAFHTCMQPNVWLTL